MFGDLFGRGLPFRTRPWGRSSQCFGGWRRARFSMTFFCPNSWGCLFLEDVPESRIGEPSGEETISSTKGGACLEVLVFLWMPWEVNRKDFRVGLGGVEFCWEEREEDFDCIAKNSRTKDRYVHPVGVLILFLLKPSPVWGLSTGVLWTISWGVSSYSFTSMSATLSKVSFDLSSKTSEDSFLVSLKSGIGSDPFRSHPNPKYFQSQSLPQTHH